MENRRMEKDVEFRSSKEVPHEIIELEILPRIPAKSLGRFMCVCKLWKMIISMPKFKRLNLHHVCKSITDHKILEVYWKPRGSYTRTFRTHDCETHNNHGSFINRSLPFDCPTNMLILGSLDGLVCLALIGTEALALWNPLTGAYKKLSYSNSSHPMYKMSNDAFGFYYDSCNNDYKLLQVASNGSLGAYIYSLRSGSCRKIQCLKANHPCISSNRRWRPATFVGESLYFVMSDSNSMESQSWIIRFDVKSEKFRVIQFPPVPDGLSYCGSVAVVEGCIHLCVSYRTNICGGLAGGVLWRMIDDDCWKKVANFSIEKHVPFRFNQVYVTRNENWLAMLEFNKVFNIIDLEDLATSFWVNLRLNRMGPDRKTTYLETLVSPDC